MGSPRNEGASPSAGGGYKPLGYPPPTDGAHLPFKTSPMARYVVNRKIGQFPTGRKRFYNSRPQFPTGRKWAARLAIWRRATLGGRDPSSPRQAGRGAPCPRRLVRTSAAGHLLPWEKENPVLTRACALKTSFSLSPGRGCPATGVLTSRGRTGEGLLPRLFRRRPDCIDNLPPKLVRVLQNHGVRNAQPSYGESR
jgi:hypothetical protein